jgi:hypothetical protein
MPKRDRYHDEVKAALVKDGWVITHDPLRLQWGAKDMYIDIGPSTSWLLRRIGGESRSR